MKKLGLIGGIGPESTLLYYKKLVYAIHDKADKDFFPPLVIESLDVYQVLAYCKVKDYTGLTEYVSKGIADLAAAGAQVAALTGNTPHIVFNELVNRSPIPLVSSVVVTARAVAQGGFHRPLLLGTLFTMREDFFKKACREAGIEAVVPDSDEQLRVHEFIERELEAGIVTETAQNYFSELIEKMIDTRKIDTVILGCTELSLLFETMVSPVPVADVTDIHVDALVKEMEE